MRSVLGFLLPREIGIRRKKMLDRLGEKKVKAKGILSHFLSRTLGQDHQARWSYVNLRRSMVAKKHL